MTAQPQVLLTQLRQNFMAQLPARLIGIGWAVDALAAAPYEPQNAVALHRLAYHLSGTAGTFGMSALSAAAHLLEQEASRLCGREEAPSTDELAGLHYAAQRLQGFVDRETDRARATREPGYVARTPAAPLIFIAEAEPAEAEKLRLELEKHGYRTRIFEHSQPFFSACTEQEENTAPALIVMNMGFAEGSEAGAFALLKQRDLKQVPTIFLSPHTDLQTRLAAHQAGASRFLAKPIDTVALLALVADLTWRSPVIPYRVLLVDDDPLRLSTYKNWLAQACFEVRTLTDPRKVSAELREFGTDVLVIDADMPDSFCPELFALREQEEHAQLPILFLSAEADQARQLQALDHGGDDFLIKPVDPDFLVATIRVRARRGRRSEEARRLMQAVMNERENERVVLDTHAIVSITDVAGNIVYANGLFCSISGYSRNELLGRNHRIIKSGIHPRSFFEEMWETISAGGVWQGEVCNRRRDGGLYWVRSSIVPCLDADGMPYQYMSIRTDITDLKDAEASLRDREQSLAIAQQVAHMGSFDWYPADGEMRWSSQLFELLGTQPDEVTPSYTVFLDFINPDDAGKVVQTIQNAMESRSQFFSCVHRLQRRDQTELQVQTEGRVHFNETGKAVRVIGTVLDITARIFYERALVAARDEAERASHAKSEFLSNMSHELRTPMNVILGFSQLLDTDPGLNADQHESVQEVLKAGRHLLDLINEVLDLARVEAGRIDISLESVDCVELLQECLTMIQPLADERGLRIDRSSISIDEELHVCADRQRLRQVLINLLSNAVKYNSAKGHIVLACATGTSAGNTRLQISDTGQGLTSEQLAEMFQPFNRLGAQNGMVEGTGIGLVISKRLIEMMGGSIGVDSQPGVGSTFWIELPLAASANIDMVSRESEAEASAATDFTRSIEPAISTAMKSTILYIEDNPANIKLVAHLLAQRPETRLISALDPVLGLQLAETEAPDVILVDINLPGIDGYEVLARLRQGNGALRQVPVIALTSNALPSDVARGFAAGFDDYLTKPINIADFLATIDAMLAQGHERNMRPA